MAIAKKKASKAKVVAKKKATAKVAVKKGARKKATKKASKKVVKKVAKVANKPAVNLKASKAAATQRPASAKSPLVQSVQKALEDMKAVNVTVLDVRGLTDVADTMVIASGNSDRHVKAIADRVVYDTKQLGFRAMGVEGERDGEWALVDLGDVIVHVMLPRVREFYRLESLWDISAARRESQM
jgi:ribosome-associated protein